MIKKIYKSIVPEKFRNQLILIRRKLYSYALLGNAVHCNCCNKSFKKFLAKGNGIEVRENAVCPFCSSLERTRLLNFYLSNETSIFKSDNPYILHIAPEKILFEKFKHNKNYIDVDINPNNARYQMDITQINYTDNTFDYIICSHVLGHIPDEGKAISELRRVLKPKGSLVVMHLLNPTLEKTYEDKSIKSESEKLKAYGESDLQRLYGRDAKERLESHNLKVIEIDYRNHFSAEELEKYRLGDGKREKLFLCSK